MIRDNKQFDTFFLGCSKQEFKQALQLWKIVLDNLRGIIEQKDSPAKMVAYTNRQKYGELICTIIPSKRGLKPGYYKGTEVPHPERLLESRVKESLCVQLKFETQTASPAPKKLLRSTLALYTNKTENLKNK